MMNGDQVLFDGRVRFYLEHRKLIETWQKVRRDANAACSELLESVQPRLEDLGAEHGLTARPARVGKWHMVALVGTETRLGSDETPLAAVTFQWTDDVILDDPSNSPSVGVRVGRADPYAPDLRERVAEVVRPERDRLMANRGRWWPIWEGVTARHGWWADDLSPYFEQIRSKLTEYVDLFSSRIDQAVRSASKGQNGLETSRIDDP